MKILLDENLPKKLKLEFSDQHQIFTVRGKGWNGKRNGELLGLMTLDVFITVDKNLQYQQNISRFPIQLFILDAPNNKIETLLPYIENLKTSLAAPNENQIQVIGVY